MTGRQPEATEPRRPRRVGALGLVGLVLLAGALVVGAARPVLSSEAARAAPAAMGGSPRKPPGTASESEAFANYWYWPSVHTTLWCGHDLHPVRRISRRERDFGREDGGMAPLRKLGDFDGDGNDDVLLRHADGRWHYYQMNGRRVLSSGAADLTQDLAWRIAGIGDFNGDGKDDVLLRHVHWWSGWFYYAMDGRRVLADSGRVLLPRHTWNWQAAIGDFDGDGRDDVLLRYSDYDDSTIGAFDRWHYYRMDGRRVLSGSGRARLTRDRAWRIAGIADLDRDGKDDVLLRKTDGRWYFYPMDGRTVLPGRGTVRMTRDLAWQVMGIGHFDGDVRKSVLLRHPNGRWWYYRIQGRQELGPFAVDLPDDTSETVAGVGDLNGDGHTDVLARRADGGWQYHALYDGRVASFGTGLSGAPALSGDLAWSALSRSNLATGTTLPGRTFIDSQDETTSLSFFSSAFENDQPTRPPPPPTPLTYRIRSSDADVVRASVTGDMLTLMPVDEGTATVTATARDTDGNSATQSFAVRYARETFQDCAECPQMVIVPAGTFTMGSPESEVERESDEGPQRTVSIPAFAASAHEVTFAQWDACAAAGGCPSNVYCLPPYHTQENYVAAIADHRVDGDALLSYPGGDFAYYPDDHGWGRRDRPVVEVNWCQAQWYARWLTRRFGRPYRLLTESEWEYAARAGTTTPFHTGETITPRQANFDGRCSYGDIYTRECNASWLYRGQTVPVGSFAPNRFGLYDMHGNVAELVEDCYGSYSFAPSDGSAAGRPCGDPSDNILGVSRGGAWDYPPSLLSH